MAFNREVIFHFNLDEFSVDKAIEALEAHREEIEENIKLVEEDKPTEGIARKANNREFCIDLGKIFYHCIRW